MPGEPMPDGDLQEEGQGALGRWREPFASVPLRYGAAVVSLLAATAFHRALQAFIAPSPFLFLVAAVVFSAWYCGRRPTLLVIALGDLTAFALFFPGVSSTVAKVLAVAAFTLVSLFIAGIGERARESFEAIRALSGELQRSEDRWRSLAESIPQIVWTAGPDGHVDYANHRWLEYTGLSMDEARARGWPMTMHPDDVPAVLERWKTSTRTGAPYEVESRLRRASDGSYRWFLSRGHPLRDAQGRIVRWFGTTTDIDDHKRSETRAQFLAQASEHLASSLDYESTLRAVTQAAIPVFADWAAVDLLGPGGAIQRVAVAHADPAKVALAGELARKYPVRPDDPVGVPNVLRTGKAELLPDVPDSLLVQVIPDPELLRIVRELGLTSSLVAPISARGKVLGAISWAMAESKRRYTRADLAVAEELGRRAGSALDNATLYRDAQLALRLKDEFLSTLSHELRTPLSAILGWAHILGSSDPLPPEKVRRGGEVIARNGRAQAQLIDDLLDVSRIVTGKMRLAVRPFSPVQVVEAAMETVRPSADARGIRLSPVLDPLAGPIVGDPDRLQQIAWNLLSNAVKFTPRGGRVQVRLARINSHVELEVADSGAGIEPAFLPRVFERFVQADASVSRSHGGLGLGLSIAKHLVELHGGTIEARSEGPGRGATFTVKLPLAPTRAPPSDEGEEVHPAASDRPAPAGHGALRGRTVLAVEDADDARDLLAEVLSEAGAEVRTAASVAEALELFGRQVPDVIISDVGMPGATGYDLIRTLRARGSRVPAIALTAYARSEDRARALSEGFDLHLPKPVDPGELVTSVAALLRRRDG